MLKMIILTQKLIWGVCKRNLASLYHGNQGLACEDGFFKNSVKKHIRDIQLSNDPIPGHSYRED